MFYKFCVWSNQLRSRLRLQIEIRRTGTLCTSLFTEYQFVCQLTGTKCSSLSKFQLVSKWAGTQQNELVQNLSACAKFWQTGTFWTSSFADKLELWWTGTFCTSLLANKLVLGKQTSTQCSSSSNLNLQSQSQSERTETHNSVDSAELVRKTSIHWLMSSLKMLNFFQIFTVGMFGSAAHQRRAKFWNKSTSLDIDSVEASSSDPNRNSFSPRSASPVSLVRNQWLVQDLHTKKTIHEGGRNPIFFTVPTQVR